MSNLTGLMGKMETGHSNPEITPVDHNNVNWLRNRVKQLETDVTEKDKRIAELEDAFMSTVTARYQVDFKWRSAWIRLANKREPGRLQSRQDRIDERAKIANLRIRRLLKIRDKIRESRSNENTR